MKKILLLAIVLITLSACSERYIVRVEGDLGTSFKGYIMEDEKTDMITSNVPAHFAVEYDNYCEIEIQKTGKEGKIKLELVEEHSLFGGLIIDTQETSDEYGIIKVFGE